MPGLPRRGPLGPGLVPQPAWRRRRARRARTCRSSGGGLPDTWPNLWIDGSGPEVAGLDRGGMPVFGGPDGQLTTEEIATIVDYLLTLE